VAEPVCLVAEVIAIRRHQIEEYVGMHGLRDQCALESAVFRPQMGYYNDVSEEAAALLGSLVNHRAFLDGNKRVGFAAAHPFLLREWIRSRRHRQGCLRVHAENDG